jgi:hypothetical protein
MDANARDLHDHLQIHDVSQLMEINVERRINHLSWLWLAALTVPIALLCSCGSISSAYSGKYNYGYPGASRPADEAVLTGHEIYDPKTHHLDEPVINVDGRTGWVMIPRQPGGRSEPGTGSFEVRLMPGIHKIQVEPKYIGAEKSFSSPKEFITLDAVAGRHYEIKLDILDRKLSFPNLDVRWNARIVEVESGKEFGIEGIDPKGVMFRFNCWHLFL